MVVGGAAVATAFITGSLSLVGFGINALVDSSASAILVWRFRAEEAGHAERADRAEHLALRIAGVAFIVIALYLSTQAIRALTSEVHSGAAVFGIVEAVASLLVLPYLGGRKYALSRRLGSPALRADSLLTLFGAALASVACLALVLQRVFGWWWVDAAAALVIAAMLARQGVLTLRES